MAVVSTFIQAHFKDFEHLLQKPVFLFQDRDFGFEEAWVSARSSRNRPTNRSG